MLKLRHKFIQMNMVLIYFFFLFCYHQHVYAKEVLVETYDTRTFIASIGAQNHSNKCLAQMRANLEDSLGVNNISDLKQYYSNFRLNQCRVESHLFKIIEDRLDDQLLNVSSNPNIVSRIDIDVKKRDVFQHVYPLTASANSLKISMEITFTKTLTNEFILNVSLWANGVVKTGNRFIVTVDIGEYLVFTSRA